MTTSVLFVGETGDSACALYRIHQPVRALLQQGWDAKATSILYESPNRLLRGVDERTGQPMKPTKIVVCRRMNLPKIHNISGDSTIIGAGSTFSPSEEMFRNAIKAGQKVYVDLDDDPWNVPEWNPAHGTLTDDEIKQWTTDMQTATGVLCSTPALAREVALHDATAHVCRNTIDLVDYPWEGLPAERTPLRLGWLGRTDFRGRDLSFIADGLRQALSGMWGQVEFWHLGADFNLPSVREILGPEFPVQIVERPWVPITQLPDALKQIDLAVVPFFPHVFNESRSYTTALALMAAGIPYVASATGEYHSLWNQGGGYAASPNEWVAALRPLLYPEYREHRNNLRTDGRALASRLRLSAADWEEAFNG